MSARGGARTLSLALALLFPGIGGLAAEDSTSSTTAAKLPNPPESTSNIPEGKTFKWDPATGWDPQVLPFDVQFYVSLPVDDKVQSVSGRYVGDTSRFDCNEAFPRFRTWVDYGYAPRPLAVDKKRQLRQMTEEPRETPTVAKLNVVHGLLPNRHYCFEITKKRRIDVDAKAFQAQLAEGVDLVLRDRDLQIAGASIPQRTYEQLRQATYAAIESQLGPRERLVVSSGTFLDTRTETLSLSATQKRGFDDIVEAQSNRGHLILNIEKNARGFILPALKALFENEALASVTESLGSDNLKQMLAWVALDPEAGLPPGPLAEISDGTIDLLGAMAEQAGTAGVTVTRAKPWAEIWTPEDLVVRSANLTRTIASLGELAAVATPAGDEQANDRASGTEATAAAGTNGDLRTAANTARDEITFVLEEDFDALKALLKRRAAKMAILVEDITREEIERLLIHGSTSASYTTQSNWYLGIDLGIAWANDVEDFFSYFGTNIYFRPINKEAGLSWSGFRRGQRTAELLKRLSITVGITVDDLEKRDLGGGQLATDQFQTPTQDTLIGGVIGDSQIVAGLGFRLSRYLRITAGALVFKDVDPDPLIDRSELAWSPLLSVSFDFDLKSSLEKRFKR